ncbi:DUF3305 domain-containing protein [Nitrincola tibetensis]|uniref:DUF3305 domain-containing protein n=1 Tax=Nitrincola tibetensis TaxID=2219697 RepID=A0A364NNI5_9GAMM|nr:DUF3305 domain-containing protein [Nitrincola tibetensis]RAU18580.1 DUF3305 domain-containing protein [Nitrincola tibetensis]
MTVLLAWELSVSLILSLLDITAQSLPVNYTWLKKGKDMKPSVHYPTLDTWPLWVRLEKHEKLSRGWPCITWSVAEVYAKDPQRSDAHMIWLQLFRDERIAYRFNLSAETPKLFVVCEEVSSELSLPRKLTCAQDVAADYMDANQPVLSIPLPEAIHAWLEAFMAEHGEVEDPKANKRRLRTASSSEGASS